MTRARLSRAIAIFLVGMLLVVALAAACGSDDATKAGQAEKEPGNLIIYSGREEKLIGPIIEQFKLATGIDVGVKYGKNPSLVATIEEEGNNSPADIFFGSDPGSLGALQHRLVLLPDTILNRVPSAFRSREGKWVGISGRSRVIVYNTEKLTEADLPDSIFDFTDPKWKGRIGWAPTNGSFQTFVTALRKAEGEDAARQWLEDIQANDPKVYPKNTPIVQAVADGEIDVGFVNHYYLFRFLAEEGESFKARNYYLKGGDPGAIVLVAGAGILDTSNNRENAEKFLEFLLSTVAQQYFASQTFEYPLVEGVKINPLLVPLSEIEVPDLDLSQLEDLEATIELLRDTGVLP